MRVLLVMTLGTSSYIPHVFLILFVLNAWDLDYHSEKTLISRTMFMVQSS